MHHRVEARTHYPQKNGAPKPSSGRKVARLAVTEGESVILNSDELYHNALSLSLLLRIPSSLPEGAFHKFTPTEKHHQRKFLGGVRVFSAKNAEAKSGVFVLLICFRL